MNSSILIRLILGNLVTIIWDRAPDVSLWVRQSSWTLDQSFRTKHSMSAKVNFTATLRSFTENKTGSNSWTLDTLYNKFCILKVPGRVMRCDVRGGGVGVCERSLNQDVQGLRLCLTGTLCSIGPKGMEATCHRPKWMRHKRGSQSPGTKVTWGRFGRLSTWEMVPL